MKVIDLEPILIQQAPPRQRYNWDDAEATVTREEVEENMTRRTFRVQRPQEELQEDPSHSEPVER